MSLQSLNSESFRESTINSQLLVRTLLLLQKRQVRLVMFQSHSFDRNELEGGRIEGVACSARRLRVGKDVAKVGVASFGAHLGALHLVRSVQALDEEIFRDWFAERRHADLAIVFVNRSEEGFVGNNIDVDAGAVVVPEFVLVWHLGSAFAHDMVLLRL